MKLKLHFIHVEPEQFSIAYFAAFRTEAVAIFGLALAAGAIRAPCVLESHASAAAPACVPCAWAHN